MSLKYLFNCNWNNTIACISKYDDGIPIAPSSSQDTWVFKPPIKTFRCDWFLGKPRCELRLNYEANNAGLKIFNPYRDVILTHIHKTQIRHYIRGIDDIQGPICGV
jgi:hypothetical protein